MNAACHAALQAAHTSQEMHTKCGACPHRIAVAATRFGCKQEAPSRVGLVHPTTCRLCKAGRQDGIKRPILCPAGVSGSYGCRQHCAGGGGTQRAIQQARCCMLGAQCIPSRKAYSCTVHAVTAAPGIAQPARWLAYAAMVTSGVSMATPSCIGRWCAVSGLPTVLHSMAVCST